jgi:hypothetical protein
MPIGDCKKNKVTTHRNFALFSNRENQGHRPFCMDFFLSFLRNPNRSGRNSLFVCRKELLCTAVPKFQTSGLVDDSAAY